MADEIIIPARIRLKGDTLENWAQSEDIPKKDEPIVIWDNSTPKIAIGDGENKAAALSYIGGNGGNNGGGNDTNTTYSLSGSGNTVILTGSDGKKTSYEVPASGGSDVVDTNTTYSLSGSGSTIKLTGSDGAVTQYTVPSSGQAASIQYRNVLDYEGVYNDGVTDSTAGIQKCLDDAGNALMDNGENCDVFFPIGRYLISAPLIIPPQVNLRGTSKTTIKKMSSAEHTFTEDGGKTFTTSAILVVNGNRISIENLRLEGDGTDEDGKTSAAKNNNMKVDGICFYRQSLRVEMTNISDVHIENCNKAITELRSLFMCSFHRVHMRHCQYGFALNGTDSDNEMATNEKTSLSIDNCWCENCGYAYDFAGLHYSTITNCGADNCNFIGGISGIASNGYSARGDSNPSKGVYNFIACRGIKMAGCGAERSKGRGIIRLKNSMLSVDGFVCSTVGTDYTSTSEKVGVFNVSGWGAHILQIKNLVMNDPFYSNAATTPNSDYCIVGYNPKDATKSSLVTVSGLSLPGSATVFGTITGSVGATNVSKKCFYYEDIITNGGSSSGGGTSTDLTEITNKTNNLVWNKVEKTNDGKKLRISFVSNGGSSTSTVPQLLKITALEHVTGSATTPSSFEATVVCNLVPATQTPSNPYILSQVCSIAGAQLEVNTDPDNSNAILITLPKAYDAIRVMIQAVIRNVAIDSSSISLT